MNLKHSFAEVVAEAEARGCKIWEVVVEQEEKELGISKKDMWDKMRRHWEVMFQSVLAGFKPGIQSMGRLVGNESVLLKRNLAFGKNLSGESTVLAAARAMGVGIVSASMGKIVAAPTAGSCGILPGVLLTVAEKIGCCEDEIIQGLFTAAGIGKVIDAIVSTSGAKAGCQAECGAATCMAAVAAVEMAGGSPSQASHAGAIALKSVIGLVCDPVAGLVEIPCVKRNAIGAGSALLAADMALAGIDSKIPIDEVIWAMKEVGDILPSSLKETSQAGLANTPTAREIEKRLLG
ncbi:MAG: L-serine ammonia-lyase, iron-sulfur-dependent, subunit alpha [Eubacteriales bacterium]